MSRSGYSYDGTEWDCIRWRGVIKSATRGARGQQFLRNLVRALDEMPIKELHADLFYRDGCMCAMGAVIERLYGETAAKAVEEWHEEEGSVDFAARILNIAIPLAQEVAEQNDYDPAFYRRKETPSERWQRMRRWASDNLAKLPGEE